MKKLLSILLSVLILSSALVALPAFAAEEGYKKGEVVKLGFTADDINRTFTGMEGTLTFGDDLSINEESVTFPHITDAMFNVTENGIDFNATNTDNYDISSDKVIIKAEFTVNKDTDSLSVTAKLDDIYYREGTALKDFEGITLPYALKLFVGDAPEATTAPDSTAASETGDTSSTDTTGETSATQATGDTSATEMTGDTSSTDSTETASATQATDSSSSSEETKSTSATDSPETTSSTEATTAPATEATEPQTTAPVTKPAEPAIKSLENGASTTQVDKFVTALKNDKDPKGSTFSLLCAKQKKVAKNAIAISWSKVKGAKSYVVYGAKCGSNYKKLKTVKAVKLTQKKLKKNTYYKYLIVAFDKNGKSLATSKTLHIATLGGKNGNAKSVSSKPSALNLKVKKSKTLKITVKAASKKVKIKNHRKTAFESSNPKIAAVNSKGKVTAKKKGACYIYAYAQNGIYKKIKVTVKK